MDVTDVLLDILIVLVAAKVATRTMRMSSRTSDRKSTRLNSSHGYISYAVFCLKKKKIIQYAISQAKYINRLLLHTTFESDTTQDVSTDPLCLSVSTATALDLTSVAAAYTNIYS